MKDMLIRNLVRPLMERVGTMVAAYLIARGLDSDVVAQAVNGLVALSFVALDLLMARLSRKAEAHRLMEGD